jgi:hypothetical protein
MKLKRASRWVCVVAALPAGVVLGFFSGYYLSLGILLLQGKGHSHDDIITVVGSGVLGAAIGALLFPVLVWFLTRARQIRPTSGWSQ